MILGIDHLVVAVPNPDAAAEAMEELVGLAFTGGGRHEAAGTFNRLAFLGDAYLELIGVFDEGLARSAAASPVSRVAAATLADGRAGLVTWSLATDDAAREVASLVAAGSPIGDVVAGARRRPDGEVVRWLCAFPELGPERAPFLIEHVLEGAEWGEAGRATRAGFAHPVGGPVRLAALTLPVRVPLAVAGEMAETVGLGFDGEGVAYAGPHAIRLAPGDPRLEAATVDLRVPGAHAPAAVARDAVVAGVRWKVRAGVTAR